MNQKAISLRWRLVAVVCVFLFLQFGLIARNGCEIDNQDTLKAIAENERQLIALRAEIANEQVERLQFIEKETEWDIDKKSALMYGNPRKTKGFLVIGIPSIERQNVTYLEDTIASLSKHASENERREVVVVVFLCDFNAQHRKKMAIKLKGLFATELQEGFLHIIKAPRSFYPSLQALERTFNDQEKRVKWRSKQNFDYAYLMKYSQNISQYYMQLEDDVVTVKGYASHIKRFISNLKIKNWSCLEFSKLGFIGKLFPSADIGRLAKFLMVFFDQQPVDLLFPYFYRIMTQKKPIVSLPSLFQHMGLHSSFNNDKNTLKDHFFVSQTKRYDGDNPSAQLITNISAFEGNTIEKAYDKENSLGFFWGKTPVAGDFVQIVFTESKKLTQLFILTGSDAYPNDKLNEGAVLVSPGNDLGQECQQYIEVTQFTNGSAIVQNMDTFVPYKIKCILIKVKENQKNWLMVREIAVFTDK